MSDQHAIEISGLSKSYRGVGAVSDISLSVPAGTICGFVGPNGAGKTTVMRMLAGLVRPTSGTGRVLGRPLGDLAALRRTGSLIESPAFYPYLSGRRNLQLLGRYMGMARGEADRLLDMVGLDRAAGLRYRTYSLGMKQRLGVAAALLGRPELLILDEPANGLDPAGVAVMREMIRALGDSGRTVLLSSHLLDQVAEICDRIAVMHEGRLVAEGTLAEIRSANGAGARFIVRAEPLAAAAERLRQLAGVAAVSSFPDRIEITSDQVAGSAITRHLVQAGIAVHQVTVADPSLERIFLQLTSESAAARGGPS